MTDIQDEGDQVRIKFKRQTGDSTEVEDEMTTKFLVAADGPSSTVRKILEPQVERKYAGYCVIRGTVPEPEASQSALDVFRERFCFFHAPGIQNLTYTIAGENGSTETGKRLLNFVWYANFEDGSPELDKIMTDKNGRRRHITIPPGMISWDAWELLKSKAADRLPPQMAEMANKTRTPFVQAITDVTSPKNMYMGDKVALVGDALAGFRPHTVASTSQAAFDVMTLVGWLDGSIDRKTFVRRTMEYARDIQAKGIKIGNRSQFETLSVQEYIDDRNMMSIPHKDIEFPGWTREDIDRI